MSRWLVAAGCLLAVPAIVEADDAKGQALDLGGPRQVRAVVALDEGVYVVKVRMVPVRAFDAATNARLNEEKAREYALQALARHLSDKRSVSYTISGARIEQAGPDGKDYALTLRVPREGVVLARADDPTDTTPGGKERRERVTFSSALFRARPDYENTTAQLAAALAADLRKAEEKDETTPEAEDPTFVRGVREIEERGLNNLDTLAGEARADLLLSAVEMFGQPSDRDAVQQGINRQKQAFRDQVAKAMQRHARKKKKEER
jgi:hypothetical protein